MQRSFELSLSGWGNYRPATCRVFRPERLADLRELATAATAANGGHDSGGTLLARGLGRSYGDSATNAGGAVALMERVDCLLDLNVSVGLTREAGTAAVVEAEAGVSLATLVDVLLPRGWFLPVTPGTRYVTLGGAIAADVHGKNHHADGTIGNFVESLRLMLADGSVLDCSPAANADVFWATVGGMGLTGIILSARLRLRPVSSAYVSVRQTRLANLDAALDHFEAAREGGSRPGGREPTYSVAWIDCLAGGASLGRSVVMEGEHLSAGALAAAGMSLERGRDPLARPRRQGRSVPFHFPGFALSRPTVRLFNEAYYRAHGDGTRAVGLDAFFYPLDAVRHWNRVYGRRGFVQYQALFPSAAARQGLREMLEAISDAGSASFLAVLKRTGEQGQGMLSFPMPGYTLALDLPNTGPRLDALLRGLDAIVLRHGGRLYLAKDATMSAEAFAAMYPRLDEFRRVKATVDPAGRFSSTQARRLKIVE
jgi:decaprenylphospho-beta-D-ribofuranose 2-oxidase